jgi:hypothetical protein
MMRAARSRAAAFAAAFRARFACGVSFGMATGYARANRGAAGMRKPPVGWRPGGSQRSVRQRPSRVLLVSCASHPLVDPSRPGVWVPVGNQAC